MRIWRLAVDGSIRDKYTACIENVTFGINSDCGCITEGHITRVAVVQVEHNTQGMS